MPKLGNLIVEALEYQKNAVKMKINVARVNIFLSIVVLF
jgi:hypothetical protein